MKTSMKFFNNDEGVSPIVATLVLIVVAIIGAAAVGLIMSSFSTNVGQQANSGNTVNSASGTISVAGSTSMQPVITTLGQWFTANNTGVKVNVAPGGSGVGYSSVEKGMADIGMISEGIISSQKASYPNLKAYQVGSSGVVFAYNGTYGAINGSVISTTDLACIFNGTTDTTKFSDPTNWGTETGVGRSDVSGTQDTAMAYLGLTTSTWKPKDSASGNGNVLAAIMDSKAHNTKIGILDSDYAFASSSKPTVLNIYDLGAGKTYTTNSTNVINEIKNNDNSYPAGLVRPLNLITNGPASTIQQQFIQFVQSPTAANQAVFSAAYQVHVSQINSAFLQ